MKPWVAMRFSYSASSCPTRKGVRLGSSSEVEGRLPAGATGRANHGSAAGGAKRRKQASLENISTSADVATQPHIGTWQPQHNAPMRQRANAAAAAAQCERAPHPPLKVL